MALNLSLPVSLCLFLALAALAGRSFSHGATDRGGLVFKAHGLLYHSTRGSRVIKKKREQRTWAVASSRAVWSASRSRDSAASFSLCSSLASPAVATFACSFGG